MQEAFLIQFQQRAATWEEGLEGASKVISGPERILSEAGVQRKSFRVSDVGNQPVLPWTPISEGK